MSTLYYRSILVSSHWQSWRLTDINGTNGFVTRLGTHYDYGTSEWQYYHSGKTLADGCCAAYVAKDGGTFESSNEPWEDYPIEGYEEE